MALPTMLQLNGLLSGIFIFSPITCSAGRVSTLEQGSSSLTGNERVGHLYIHQPRTNDSDTPSDSLQMAVAFKGHWSLVFLTSHLTLDVFHPDPPSPIFKFSHEVGCLAAIWACLTCIQSWQVKGKY
jgi:hypothetical protein